MTKKISATLVSLGAVLGLALALGDLWRPSPLAPAESRVKAEALERRAPAPVNLPVD